MQIVKVDRPDRRARRRMGKSDPLDALAAARAALSGEAAGTPKTRSGPVEAIRALRVARRGDQGANCGIQPASRGDRQRAGGATFCTGRATRTATARSLCGFPHRRRPDRRSDNRHRSGTARIGGARQDAARTFRWNESGCWPSMPTPPSTTSCWPCPPGPSARICTPVTRCRSPLIAMVPVSLRPNDTHPTTPGRAVRAIGSGC